MAVKRYNGSSWDVVAGVGAQGAAATSSTITTWVKTAAGGETSLSGNDDNSQSLSYTIGQELVFINGSLQKRGSDYTATSGTSINGLTALAANDVVTVWSNNAFSVTNAISNTIVDAKGDVLVGTAADTPGRLAVGTDGQVLTAASTTGTGLAWATPSSGALTLISRQTGSAASSIDFNGVFTSTYQAYMIVIENLTGSSTGAEMRLQLKYGTSTTQSSGYYGNSAYVAFNSSTWTFSTQSNRGDCILMASGLSSDPSGATLYVTPGNTAVRPAIYGYGMNSQQGGPTIFGFQPASQTYTGFLITASAGTITGSVSCYGLAKS
jgi:hypothetical protein